MKNRKEDRFRGQLKEKKSKKFTTGSMKSASVPSCFLYCEPLVRFDFGDFEVKNSSLIS
jgi:hypothetical protein